MIAAAYLRKSTTQDGRADEEKSVAFQREHITAFAVSRGWVLSEDHIFVDDGISGAEFARRPGFVRLMNSLKPRPPFQALVMYDESRLGREQIETAYALKTLITAGVQVWFSKDGRQRTLDSPTEKMMLSLENFASEMQRVQTAARTRDTMFQKARTGHVAGGCVFAYTNKRIVHDGHRAHVERRIVDAEAAVVREIFELCAQGWGFRRIAVALNDRKAPAPKPRRTTTVGWSPSTVRDVLHRELYRGRIVYGKRKKRDQWGQKRPTLRPQDEWVVVPAEHLRIVSDDLWTRAQARLKTSREAYIRSNGGKLFGKPGNGAISRYLLTGLALCGACGGALTVRFSSKAHHRHQFYHCLTHIQRGPSVCRNSVGLPMREIDARVLTMFEAQLLDRDVMLAAIQEAVRRLQEGTSPAHERARLAKRLAALATEVKRLTTAIATAGRDIPALVQALEERERERTRIEADLQRLGVIEQAHALSAQSIGSDLGAQLVDWQGLLRANVQQARQAIRKLLDGRLVVMPNADMTEFVISGVGVLEPLLTQLVSAPKAGVTPAGFEPAISTLKGSRPWPG